MISFRDHLSNEKKEISFESDGHDWRQLTTTEKESYPTSTEYAYRVEEISGNFLGKLMLN